MTYQKYFKLPLVALAVAYLSGCASLLNEDTQELNVRVMCSGKAVQAYCRAENSKGSWTFNSPGQVTVAGDNRGLEITCKTQFRNWSVDNTLSTEFGKHSLAHFISTIIFSNFFSH